MENERRAAQVRCDLNPQHAAYEADALPAELPRQLSWPGCSTRQGQPVTYRGSSAGRAAVQDKGNQSPTEAAQLAGLQYKTRATSHLPRQLSWLGCSTRQGQPVTYRGSSAGWAAVQDKGNQSPTEAAQLAGLQYKTRATSHLPRQLSWLGCSTRQGQPVTYRGSSAGWAAVQDKGNQSPTEAAQLAGLQYKTRATSHLT